MGFADISALDVTSWPPDRLEQRGKRRKVWVTRMEDGSSWLRKSVSERPPRPYEHLGEAFVLELARQSGVESALAFPCTWTESGQEFHGLISRYFLAEDEFLLSGAEILSAPIARLRERGLAYEYAYSLELLLNALPALDKAAPGAASGLLKMLTFDAWVGKRGPAL